MPCPLARRASGEASVASFPLLLLPRLKWATCGTGIGLQGGATMCVFYKGIAVGGALYRESQENPLIFEAFSIRTN